MVQTVIGINSAMMRTSNKKRKKMDYKKELQEIIDQVESAKNRLAEVAEAMDFDDREVDSLDEALDALDDAIDIITDSLPVDVELEEKTPPEILWHGTGEKYVHLIDEQGLIPKSRLYVHLSSDRETAKQVGSRHGRPVVYEIDCRQMSEDGYRFFESANHVWLTKEVPARYLKKIEETGLAS